MSESDGIIKPKKITEKIVGKPFLLEQQQRFPNRSLGTHSSCEAISNKSRYPTIQSGSGCCSPNVGNPFRSSEIGSRQFEREPVFDCKLIYKKNWLPENLAGTNFGAVKLAPAVLSGTRF